MSLRILTIDDSKMVRLMVGKVFKPFDCVVMEAANGAEGIERARENKPDVIVLDYTMPVMDGMETMVALRADPYLKDVPVIMLTAESARDTMCKMAELGVRDYLVKPFNEATIAERVGRVVALKMKGAPSENGPAAAA